MSLKSVAEEYFSSINSIAARLCSDLEETKSSYEELWSRLPEKEQQAILTESIIKPEISIKYCSNNERNFKPSSKTDEYAVKLIFEDNCSYRDEHSAPFSFRTQSQRDLSLFQIEKINDGNKNKMLKPKLKQVPLLYQDSILEHEIKNPEISIDSTNNALPKTGLDFLDNW